MNLQDLETKISTHVHDLKNAVGATKARILWVETNVVQSVGIGEELARLDNVIKNGENLLSGIQEQIALLESVAPAEAPEAVPGTMPEVNLPPAGEALPVVGVSNLPEAINDGTPQVSPGITEPLEQITGGNEISNPPADTAPAVPDTTEAPKGVFGKRISPLPG